VPTGFDVLVDRQRDMDLLASMVAGVIARSGDVAPGGKDSGS
jgi:hypothetical protein